GQQGAKLLLPRCRAARLRRRGVEGPGPFPRPRLRRRGGGPAVRAGRRDVPAGRRGQDRRPHARLRRGRGDHADGDPARRLRGRAAGGPAHRGRRPRPGRRGLNPGAVTAREESMSERTGAGAEHTVEKQVGNDDYSLERVPTSARYSWWSVATQRFGQLSALAQFLLGATLGMGMTFWQAVL